MPANRRLERSGEEARPSAPGAPPDRPSRGGSSQEPRAARKPRLAKGWAVPWLRRFQLLTGIIVVVGASVLVAWALHRYLRSSPRFAVKTVQVEGNERRTAHQVAARGGIELGKNIFNVDDQVAAAAIAGDPWIAEAEVNTELPGSVFIKVVEREAAALAAIGAQLFLVDTGGEVFKRLGEGDPHDLTVITGLDVDQIAGDREGTTVRLRRVLDLLGDLERVGIAKRYPIQEVNVQPDDSLTVTIGSDAIALSLGTPPYRSKIQKAKRILGELRHRKVKPAILFIDNRAHPERVVVRMR
ncbi:MAG: FtsQ-type POTRA domain-containing protein [Deltaproteobacteria bacterium]|nr:FtsQ-type POTRA domain-containing protein [Deltaproteobacteria bacterium]